MQSTDDRLPIWFGGERKRMPTYVYQEILEDGSAGEVFELVQRMADEALTRHPKTGRAVRRVLQPPGVPAKNPNALPKPSLDNRNLERLGFTKYEKTSDGKYEKTVGTGPSMIQRGDYE